MRFDESSADCRVFTYKEGPLSPFGHDLELRVGRFTVEVADDRQSVEARFGSGSLTVVGALVGGRTDPAALSARDRASIEATIAADVLQSRRHPEIRFQSTAVTDDEVRGTLTLTGRSREIVCRREMDGARQSASVRIHQPDFGITPYRAMLGALRVQADVLVRVSFST